jgi:hypothetical protein
MTDVRTVNASFAQSVIRENKPSRIRCPPGKNFLTIWVRSGCSRVSGPSARHARPLALMKSASSVPNNFPHSKCCTLIGLPKLRSQPLPSCHRYLPTVTLSLLRPFRFNLPTPRRQVPRCAGSSPPGSAPPRQCVPACWSRRPSPRGQVAMPARRQPTWGIFNRHKWGAHQARPVARS